MFNFILHGNGTLTDFEDKISLEKVANIFARNGFSKTRMGEIAYALGISEGELREKYDEKLTLFNKVSCFMLTSTLNDYNDKDVVRSINKFIDFIRVEVLEDTLLSQFFDMFINSKDIPDDSYDAIRECVKATSLYATMENAKKQGYLVNGNVYEVLKRFATSSFTMMKGYTMAGLMIPENDVFLNIVSFREVSDVFQSREIIKQQSSVIAAFASEFENILFVDLDTGIMNVYQSEEDSDPWVDEMAQRGFSEFNKRYSEAFIAPSGKEQFLKEMDADNIKMKLDEDPVYYVEHEHIMNGERVKFETKIVLDPMYAYGNKVLMASHRVYK